MEKITSKNVFLINFFILLFCFCAAQTNFFPLLDVLVKYKYIYLIIAVIDLFIGGGKRKIRINRKVLFIFFLLFLYYFLFSFVFVDAYHAQETKEYAINLLIYFTLLIVTFEELKKYRCPNQLYITAYFCLSFFLFICFITHLNRVSWNPLFILRIFSEGLQSRADFGGTHKNIIAFFVYIQLALFFIILTNGGFHKYLIKWKPFLFILLFNLAISYFILISASARGAILSVVVMIIAWGWLKLFFSRIKNNRIIALGLLIFCILIFFIFNIWDKMFSSRIYNIEGNLDVFELYGNKWTGMGLVENYMFQDKTGLWPGSTSLDVFYAYVYFTTGIIGCIIMGAALLSILYFLARSVIKSKNYIFLAVFLSILFYLIWDVILFSAKCYQMFVLLLAIIYEIESSKECKKCL